MDVRIVAVGLLLALAACRGQNWDQGQPTKVAEGPHGVTLTFGAIERVRGTPFVTVPVVVGGQGADSFSIGGNNNNERNRLIVDTRTGASRRVLPDDTAPIVNWIEPTGATNEGPVIDNVAVPPRADSTAESIYAAVVRRGSPDDKKGFTYDVLVGRFDSGKQIWLARGLEGVQSIWMTPDGRLAMVAAANGRGIYRLYDPATFQQLLETDLKL